MVESRSSVVYGGDWKLICVWKSLQALFFFLFVFFIEEPGSIAYTNVWGSLEAQLCMEEPGSSSVYGGTWKLLCIGMKEPGNSVTHKWRGL